MPEAQSVNPTQGRGEYVNLTYEEFQRLNTYVRESLFTVIRHDESYNDPDWLISMCRIAEELEIVIYGGR